MNLIWFISEVNISDTQKINYPNEHQAQYLVFNQQINPAIKLELILYVNSTLKHRHALKIYIEVLNDSFDLELALNFGPKDLDNND